MSVKQPSLRGLTAWFVVVAIFLGVTFAGATALNSSAKRQDAAEKNKQEEKKDEKKEEKKDEKKGLPLKSDRKIEFTTPSWAPDGKYIFVSKAQFGIGSSEIWMYHVDGGSGVQITKSKPTPT